MPTRHLQTTFFFGLLLAALGVMYLLVRPYLAALVFAGTLAVIWWPAHRRLGSLFRHPTLAAAVSMLLVLSVVLLPLAALTTSAIFEAQQLINLLSHQGLFNRYLRQLLTIPEAFVGQFSPTFSLPQVNVDEYLRQLLHFFVSRTGVLIFGITGTLLQLLVFLYALYYFFKAGEYLPQLFARLSPLPNRYDRLIIGRVHTMVTSVIQGSLLLATIQGVLTGVGFAIFGVPGPILWGMLTIPISFVPWFGTALTIVPAIFYLLISDRTAAALGLTIWGAVVVGLIDNLLNPKFIGARAKVNPLLVLVSVLGGLQVFGAMGFVVGPIVLSIFLALLELSRLKQLDTVRLYRFRVGIPVGHLREIQQLGRMIEKCWVLILLRELCSRA